MAMDRLQERRRESARGAGRHLREEQGRSGTSAGLQAGLGNALVGDLLVNGPGDAADLYLADLLSASAETGEDLSAFLPGRASGTWMDFARAWYRVLWAERTRDDVDVAPRETDFGGIDVSFEAVGVDAAIDGSVEVAPAVEAESSEAVARDARGPNIADPGEMSDWFGRLERQSGSGRPLTLAERDFLETVHHRPIPTTRIHEGAFAREASAQIDARAFSVGSEVWMGEDVDLADPSGAELLAHEITHVIQNALGRGGSGKPVSSPSDATEREAEARGQEGRDLVARGEWAFAAPEGVGAQGRFLAGRIAANLPSAAPPAPDALVREGLVVLLGSRASDRIAALREDLRALDPDRADVREAAGRLDAARAAVATAGTDLASIGTLLRIGGAPSASELASLQVGFAPYPSFAAQAGALLDLFSEGPGLEVGPATPTGTVGLDPEQAIATAALVERLSHALGLSPGDVDVRTDAHAVDRLAAVGAPGLYEGGSIFLDPSAFDPSTTQGAALLAHEMVHQAQDGLAPFATSEFDAGGLAEAEAHVAGDALAAGGSFHALAMGLPDGHVAAKGDLLGDGLRNLIQAYQGVAESVKGTFGPQAPVQNDAQKNASQNRQKKLSQYEDGVDGIADEIGDLDAFDDLCDVIDEDGDKKDGADTKADKGGKSEKPSSTAGPLARIKASKSYKELCRMWQGAKEGGEDSAAMMAAFDNEFDGRGFWGSTERAFDLVEANAKRDAKPEPIAEEGKKNAKDAKNKVTDPKQADKGKGGKADLKDAGNGLAVDKGGGDYAQFLGASVEDELPKIDSFATMNSVSDEALADLTRSVDEYNGFSVDAQKPDAGSRTDEILGTLWDNFSSSFASGFTDQFVDTMVWDTIGKGGDKLLSLATKGKIGGAAAPMIGPMIGLGQQVWSAFDKDGFHADKLLMNASGAGKMGEGFSSFGKMNETLGNLSKCNGVKDVIGVLFAAAADFFQGLRDLADGLATLCGTLSALCYIVGGVLILVGIATAWLGWGVGLITAGNWLVNAGGILARINTALGLLVIFLSGITTLFRTIAAFTVPATLYQEQLQGVGTSASNFGEKTGAKSGDMTANKIKDGVQKRIDARNADKKNTTGEEDGTKKHQDADADIDAQNKKLEDVDDKLKEEAEKVKEDEKKNKKGDDEGDATAATPKKSFGQKALKTLDTLTQYSELKNSLRELKDVSRGLWRKDVRQKAAAEAMRPEVAEGTLKHLDETMKAQQQKILDLQEQLKGAKDGGLSDAEIKKIQNKLNKQEKDFAQGKADLEALKAEVKKVQDIDAALQKEKDVEDENEKRKKKGEEELDSPIEKELADRKKALTDAEAAVEKANKALTDAEANGNKKVSELEQKKADAEARAKKLREEIGDPDEAKKTVDAHNKEYQDKRAQEIAAHDKKVEGLADEAHALETKATNAEKADKLRTESEGLAPKIEKGQKNLTAALNSLEQHIGKTIVIKGGTGNRKMSDANLRGVESDGLIVTDGKGGTKKIPFSDVFGPQQLGLAANRAATEQKNLTTLNDKKSSIDSELKGLPPAGTDPKALREQAQAKRDEAMALADQGANLTPTPEHPLTTKTSEAGKLDGEAATIQKQIESEKAKVDDAKKGVNDANSAKTDAQKGLKETEEKKQRMEDQAQLNGYLRDSSSGNATGGVGSAFKFWGEGLERLIISWDAVTKATHDAGVLAGLAKAAETFKEPGEGDDRPKSLGQVVSDKLLGLKAQSDDALKQIGAKRAAIERALELAPPVDIEETKKRRLSAAEHFKAYKVAHDEALQAWKAEQAVEKLSKDTKALADAGKPIEMAAQSMDGPLRKSLDDEGKRNSLISGQDPDAPEQEGGSGGLVAELIKKLASHSDAMDQQPNAGGGNGGKAVEDGQKKGKEDSKKNVDQAQSLSDQQRAFLDEAIVLRGEQEANVCENIETMNQKYAEEQAIKAEIQTVKAKALATREAERTAVEQDASAFNADYEQLSAWAVDHDARMDDVAAAGK